MRLNKNNTSNFINKMKNYQSGSSDIINSSKKPLQNTLSFTGREDKFIASVENGAKNIVLSKFAGGNVNYQGINKVEPELKKIIGKDSETIFNSISSDKNNNALVLKYNSLLTDTWETLSYPFLKMPQDIILSVTKKINPDYQPKKGSILFKRLKEIETEKNKKLLGDIMETYVPKAELEYNDEDISRLNKRFKRQSALNIITQAKNYKTRDERTLNRFGTSLVSSIFAATDFYNITMLKKDNKEEANKSAKARFKQEFSRGLISGSLTFFTLGALSRYTKTSVPLNAAVIAGSTLISEISSRLISKTPLVPLTPKQAEEIAHKNKSNDKKTTNDTTTQTPNNQQTQSTAFKGKVNLAISSQQEKLFAKFTSKDGSFSSLKSLVKSNAKEAKVLTSNIANKEKQNTEINNSKITVNSKKSPNKILKILLGALALSNGLFIYSKFKKGEFAQEKELHALFNVEGNKEKLEKFLEGKTDKLELAPTSDGKTLESIINTYKGRKTLFETIKDKLTKREIEIDLKDLEKQIETFRASGKVDDLSEIFDIYKADIQNLANKNQKLKAEVDVPVVTSLVTGVSDLFKKVGDILSFPSRIILAKVNSKYDKSSKMLMKANDLTHPKIKKEVQALYNIFNKKPYFSLKAKPIDLNDEKNINKIEKKIRNDLKTYEPAAETGDLASLSRTLVTIISSYFFINDYRNKVLIESEGKDVDGANAEMRQRGMHKLSNFFINGTLMNLFNTATKVPLNNSLAFATVEAMATELTNETLIRKSICQPIKRMDSKQAILDYDEKQTNKKGIGGAWSRFFKKITGKKTSVEKVQDEQKKK